MSVTREEAVQIWRTCDRIANLSDRVLKFGPFNLGLDAALAVLPIGGGLYTIGLGGWMVYMGWKAGAEQATLLRMAAYVGVDAATAEVPLLGSMVDMLFPGHVLAAKELRKDIERRFGPIRDGEPSRRGRWQGFADRLRNGGAQPASAQRAGAR